MSKRVRATDAKNNFGGLLEEVMALGRVDIVRHGRLVGVLLSPRAFESLADGASEPRSSQDASRSTHMIPPELARAARLRRTPGAFDDG